MLVQFILANLHGRVDREMHRRIHRGVQPPSSSLGPYRGVLDLSSTRSNSLARSSYHLSATQRGGPHRDWQRSVSPESETDSDFPGLRVVGEEREDLHEFGDDASSGHELLIDRRGDSGTSVSAKLRVLEAILLIAKEPLSARKIAVLAELADPTEARTLARRLNEEYDRFGYSFRIEEIAGGLQLLTRPQFARWIRRLELVPGEVLLSQGMLEALSIIAYRQPIQRSEIEAIRGVSSDEVLRQLMQRDLIRIAGRLEDLGRPYLYGTTRTFLQLFGLQSLDSLPRAQKIREAEAEIASRLSVHSSASDGPSSKVGEE